MALKPLRSALTDLQTVLDFIQLDLDNLSPSARLKQDRKLYALETRGALKAYRFDDLDNAERLTEDGMEQIQKRAAVTVQHFLRTGPKGHITSSLPLKLSFLAASPDGSPGEVMFAGPRLDVFMYVLMRLLATVGPARIRRCSAENCGRLFVKVTKKEFCSTTCQSRTYMRSYRAAAAQVETRKGNRRVH